MAAPPLLAGAVKVTTEEALALEVAVPMVGAPGTVEGTMAVDGTELGPVPTELVAVTVNVYDVPSLRPLTVHPAGGPEVSSYVHCAPPGEAVTVSSIIGEAPVLAGSVQV